MNWRASLVALCWLAAAPHADSAIAIPSDLQVKAAYLYNFAKFVEWPSGAFRDGRSPIVIGVYGDDSFGRVLDETVQGKDANGRVLVVRRSGRLGDLRACHILFIGASHADDIGRVAASLSGTYALTVGDSEDFATSGGMIGFRTVGSRVRFQVNVARVRRAGLTISSKLLKLAEVVGD